MKDVFRFGLRLLVTHAAVIMMTMFFMVLILYFLKTQDSQFWGMLIFVLIYFLAIWLDCVKKGKTDKVKRKVTKHSILKGFIASLLLLAPAIILVVFMQIGFPTIYNHNFGQTFFLIWMMPFNGPYIKFNNLLPQLAYATILFICLICTLGYIYGLKTKKQ